MNKVKVIIDSPVKNSSLYYSSGFYCLDPFVLIDTGNDKIGFLPSTELEKAKANSNLTEIYNLTDEFQKINKEKKYPALKSSLVIDYLNKNNIHEIYVPESFPLREADNLRKYNIKVVPVEEPFYKSRVSKNELELKYIRDNSIKNSQVMQEVYEILAESSITNNKKIKYNGEILTAEFIQNFILKSFLDKDMSAEYVIVACGDQGCFPHEYGSGELYANTSIIVDIFPRNRTNLYYTDMTRTFCKGNASDDLKLIYNTVLDAQKLGLEKVHAREVGKVIHKNIQEYFARKGFKTGIIDGVLQGFFHGTGHGVGLDCHELPYISNNGGVLDEKSVVTVEPGLYYLGKGAVRIEDIVVVEKDGIENLTDFHKTLEVE